MSSSELASRAMSRANVPRWQLICGALVIRPARNSSQLVRPSGWKGGGGAKWSSTLLGPEGTGVEPSLGPVRPTADAEVRGPGPPVS